MLESNQTSDLRGLIEEEFMRRREKNPKYSLRGYARHLEVDPSLLSKVLRNKRNISKNLSKKISDKLWPAPETTEATQSAEI
jgi:plasmid maintenance system antidote protein VapI